MKQAAGHKPRSAGPIDVEEEELPEESFSEMSVTQWRRLRRENPYRFHAPTYTEDDGKFWTVCQRHMWDEFYDNADCMKRGLYVLLGHLIGITISVTCTRTSGTLMKP